MAIWLNQFYVEAYKRHEANISSRENSLEKSRKSVDFKCIQNTELGIYCFKCFIKYFILKLIFNQFSIET